MMKYKASYVMLEMVSQAKLNNIGGGPNGQKS